VLTQDIGGSIKYFEMVHTEIQESKTYYENLCVGFLGKMGAKLTKMLGGMNGGWKAGPEPRLGG